MADTGAAVSSISTQLPLFSLTLTRLQHQFLYAPDCPVNLLGRDFLTKLGLTIHCSDKGLLIQPPSFPRPNIIGSSIWHQQTTSQKLWHKYSGLDSWQLRRKASLRSGNHRSSRIPETPATPDEKYTQAWEEEKEGGTGQIGVENIYLGKEGVAAHCILTPEQLNWYALRDTQSPTSSLLLAWIKNQNPLEGWSREQ